MISLTAPVLIVRTPTRGPYRRILLTVDFSEVSSREIQTLKERFPSREVQVLHVMDDRSLQRLRELGLAETSLENQYRVNKDRLTQQLQRLVADSGMPSSDVSLFVESGSPRDVILERVKEWQPDLVVMGASGRSRLSGLVRGRVAGRLIHELHTDVLLAGHE